MRTLGIVLMLIGLMAVTAMAAGRHELLMLTPADEAAYDCELHGRCAPPELTAARLMIATLDTPEPGEP